MNEPQRTESTVHRFRVAASGDVLAIQRQDNLAVVEYPDGEQTVVPWNDVHTLIQRRRLIPVVERPNETVV